MKRLRNGQLLRSFMLAVFAFGFAAMANATGFGTLDFQGPSNFQVSGSTVHITISKIANSSATITSGSLRLDLWAFTSPYAGGTYSGYKTASIRTNQLTGLSDQLGPSGTFTNITMDLTYTAPASGYTSFSLFLMQFSSTCTATDHFCVTAYLNYSSTPTSTNYSLSGIVADRSGSRISEATVTLTGNGQTFSGTTDGNGTFNLVFDRTGIPTTVAFTVTKTGYIPLASPLTLNSSNGTNIGTLTMDIQGADVVAVEVVPELHHLGDDSFSGSVNSQFQRSTEGVAFSRAFTVTTTQSAGSSASVTLLAKGLQYSNTLRINGSLVGYLNSSPADGSFGSVTFNSVPMTLFRLGGNTLAIGSGTDGGDYDDFEFANVIIRFNNVSSIPPAPPNLQFNVVNGGGVSTASPGSGDPVTVGYGKIQPTTGSSAPSGLAIFGFRQNNILVSEAGVPATPALLTGRIYAEVGGAVNTGLAIANPSSQLATVSFYFTDASGNFGSGSTTIPANGQIARFLDQTPFTPFNGPGSFRGTFTFTSTVPVAVIALRGLTNERGQFLITTLPVADLSAPASSAALNFPHFADGGGWTTQVVLVNPTDSVIAGSVLFRDPSGQTTTLTASGLTNSSFLYAIPPGSSQRLQTSGAGTAIRAGSVLVTPTTGVSPSGLAIFSYRSGGATVTEAGVPAVTAANAFRLYAESAGNFGAIGSMQTGLAIANTSSAPASVTVEVTRLDGSSVGLTGTIAIPANGQVSVFSNQITGLTGLPIPFQGVLRVSSSAAISVVGLRGRYNELGDFLITTTPSVNEASATSSATLYFPHLADAGGYTTQFIIFSGRSGQLSSGTLTLFTQSGLPLTLTLR